MSILQVPERRLRHPRPTQLSALHYFTSLRLDGLAAGRVPLWMGPAGAGMQTGRQASRPASNGGVLWRFESYTHGVEKWLHMPIGMDRAALNLLLGWLMVRNGWGHHERINAQRDNRAYLEMEFSQMKKPLDIIQLFHTTSFRSQKCLRILTAIITIPS